MEEAISMFAGCLFDILLLGKVFPRRKVLSIEIDSTDRENKYVYIYAYGWASIRQNL